MGERTAAEHVEAWERAEVKRGDFEDFCWGEMEGAAIEFCRRAPIGSYVFKRADGLEVYATLCASHVHDYAGADRLAWKESGS